MTVADIESWNDLPADAHVWIHRKHRPRTIRIDAPELRSGRNSGGLDPPERYDVIGRDESCACEGRWLDEAPSELCRTFDRRSTDSVHEGEKAVRHETEQIHERSIRRDRASREPEP
ncbi:hypothetical protein ACI3KS_08860 [Microbacterium sp. ZW T5_45]|uniref:hypothetical protein n=1 Tax=Microbacterium sp. ZW T5_45 TaxID=3378080 RepID=UPI00385204EE